MQSFQGVDGSYEGNAGDSSTERLIMKVLSFVGGTKFATVFLIHPVVKLQLIFAICYLRSSYLYVDIPFKTFRYNPGLSPM